MGFILNQSRPLVLLATAGLFAGMTGCATTGDLDTLRDQVARATSQAEAAQAEAATASREAAEAKRMAQGAMTTANQASDTANQARATSQDTESKIDRMFKKAMYK